MTVSTGCSTCSTLWYQTSREGTLTSGMEAARLMPLSVAIEILKPVKEPGPAPVTNRSISFTLMPASAQRARILSIKSSLWRLPESRESVSNQVSVPSSKRQRARCITEVEVSQARTIIA